MSLQFTEHDVNATPIEDGIAAVETVLDPFGNAVTRKGTLDGQDFSAFHQWLVENPHGIEISQAPEPLRRGA